jgi:hypothetical protein
MDQCAEQAALLPCSKALHLTGLNVYFDWFHLSSPRQKTAACAMNALF